MEVFKMNRSAWLLKMHKLRDDEKRTIKKSNESGTPKPQNLNQHLNLMRLALPFK